MKQWYQDRMYARVIRMDGRVDRVQLDCMEDCGTLIASFPEQADWTDIRTVEFAPEMGQNKAGQDGYYIMTPFQRVGLVCRVIRATRNLAE